MYEDVALSVEIAAPSKALWSIVVGAFPKRNRIDDGRVDLILEIGIYA